EREQHYLWAGPRPDGAHHDQGWRSGAVELLRLSDPANERRAADAHRGDIDRQPTDRCWTDGHSVGDASDWQRDCPAHRRALAPRAVHAGAHQESTGVTSKRPAHYRARLARVWRPYSFLGPTETRAYTGEGAFSS